MEPTNPHPDGFPLWRQFRAEPRFAAGTCAVVLLATILIGSVLPIWHVGPASPAALVRISGLAWAESRFHGRRTAEPQTEQDFESAQLILRQALALNPANLEALRASVRRYAQKPLRRPGDSFLRIRDAIWLLRVSGTNSEDVLLALKIFEEVEADDLIPSLVSSLRNPGPTEIESGLRSLLRTVDPRFHSWRPRLGAAPQGSSLELLDLAASALWSTDDAERTGNRRRLEAIADDPSNPLGTLAARLGCAVASRTGNAPELLLALERATRRGIDPPSIHAEAWRRLKTEGRDMEAIRRANEFQGIPRDVRETVLVAEALADLGMVQDGLRYLERHAQGAEPQEAFWRCRSRLLEQSGQWEDLLGLALDLRRRPAWNSALGESQAIEGRALWGKGRHAEANARFRAAAKSGFVGAEPAILAAHWCEEAGFLALALEVIRSAQPFPSEIVGHANECFRIALDIGDPDHLGELTQAGQGGANADVRILRNRMLALEALDGDIGESMRVWETPQFRQEDGRERRILGALVFNRLGMPSRGWQLQASLETRDENASLDSLGILAASESLEGLGFHDESLRLLGRMDTDSLVAGFLARLERLERRLEASLESLDENRN